MGRSGLDRVEKRSLCILGIYAFPNIAGLEGFREVLVKAVCPPSMVFRRKTAAVKG